MRWFYDAAMEHVLMLLSSVGYDLSFLSSMHFYYLLLIGAGAMIPRARYVLDRAAGLSAVPARVVKPSLAQRACLFIPGLSVFMAIVLLANALAAGVLLFVFIGVYIAMILFFRG